MNIPAALMSYKSRQCSVNGIELMAKPLHRLGVPPVTRGGGYQFPFRLQSDNPNHQACQSKREENRTHQPGVAGRKDIGQKKSERTGGRK